MQVTIDNIINEKGNIREIVHDLKLPITSIMGFTELLKKGAYDEKTKDEFFDIILSESHRLLKLIDEILKAPEISNEQNPNKCNINIQVHKYAKAMSPLASKKNIEISLNVNSNNIYVSIPENKISRILTNIIENAIKYNKEKGKIFIDVTEDKNRVNIKIKDTGIGIAQHELDKIFIENYRSEACKDLNISGSGLGLSIAKKFAEDYGGSINVTSKLGFGTEFTVSFPKMKLDEE